MRTTYLVRYYIADDKRLRRVFKTCRDYGDHLQFSIFECKSNPAERARPLARRGGTGRLQSRRRATLYTADA